MANGCTVQTKLGTVETDMFHDILQEDVDYAMDKVFGTISEAQLILGQQGKIGKKALEAYKELRDYVRETINTYAQIIGYSNMTQDHINGLVYTISDIIQEYTGVLGAKESLIEHASAREALSAFNVAKKAVKIQRRKVLAGSRGNKILNAFERAFFLPHFTAYRVSIGGDIYRYIKRLQFFAEDVRKASHRFRKRYAQTKKDYYDFLYNKLLSMDYITSDYTMDGVQIGNYIYLGSKKQDGAIVHVVKDESGKVQELPSSELSKSEIVEAVVDKYLNELTDDLMNGQAMYVEWGKIDKNWIEYIYRKMHDKRTQDPDDFRRGLKEVHVMVKNGTRYYYTFRKRGKRDKKTGIFHPELDKYGREVYDGYILWKKDSSGKVTRFYDRHQKELIKLLGLENGFYKSREDRVYGRKYNPRTRKLDEYGRYERGFSFDNIDKLRIKPHPDLVSATASTKTSSLWHHVATMRQLYRNIGMDMMRQWDILGKKYRSSFNKLLKIISSHPDKMVLDQLEGIMKLGMRFHIDDDGNVVSPNSGFQLMSDNYSPIMFNIYDLQNMLMARIDEMSRRYKAAVASGQDTTELSQDLEIANRFLMSLLGDKTADRPPDNIGTIMSMLKAPHLQNEAAQEAYVRLIVGSSIGHWERRSTWTDRTMRRRDAEVFYDYIDQTYYAMKKQEVLLDLIDIAHDRVVNKTAGKHGEVIDWLVNRTRIQFRDPGHEAKIGPINISYEALANTLNKFKVFGNHDAESIERFITSTRAMFASILLGASVGLVNRSQILNSIVRYGTRLYREANAIVEGEDKRLTKEQLDAIMDYLGVDDLVNIFTEWVSRGNDIGLRDAMAIPFIISPFQIPGAGAKNLATAKAREKLIRTLPVINRVNKLAVYNDERNRARRLALKRSEVLNSIDGLDRKKVEMFTKLYESYRERLKSPDERAQIEDAIEAIYDYILSGNADKNGIPYKRLKKVLPGVTETILRRAVSWKVSWMPFAGAKGLFTMTESERIMRRTDAMMALLFAAERGVLGKYGNDFRSLPKKEIEYIDRETGEKRLVSVPAIFVSDSAVRIARNSVYSTMFGLSIYHQGEAFAGLGQQIFMYKSYPLNQTVHDYKIMSQFLKGGNAFEAIPRILKAYGDIATGKTKNPNAKVDWPAVRAARFLASRVAMTGVLLTMELIPMLRRILFTVNSPTTSMLRSLVMGAESPFIRIGIRMMLNALIFSSFDTDDQDEKRLIYDILDIVRLFFPVFITYPAYLLWGMYNKIK